MLAGLPTNVAYAESARQFRYRIIALSLAALLALAVAMTVSYAVIIRRLRSLVTMARRIGTGDLAARSNVRTMDEIGELGRALDGMADDLRHRDAERARLLTAVVEASEDERRRIAHDVHDDPIQVMSAHVMRLQLLRRQVEDPELKAQIVELEESGRAATARLRNLVFELHSPILEEHGLEAALDVLLERTFDGLGVEYTVESTLTSEPPDATRDTAYRIAQEAIRNTHRHAGAHSVHVELRRDADDLVLRVVDDGEGFIPEALEDRPGHLGLRAVRERALSRRRRRCRELFAGPGHHRRVPPAVDTRARRLRRGHDVRLGTQQCPLLALRAGPLRPHSLLRGIPAPRRSLILARSRPCGPGRSGPTRCSAGYPLRDARSGQPERAAAPRRARRRRP